MSVRILSNELQEKACRELYEVPNRVQSDIEHLRQWLEKQYHIIARKDDQTLLNFLRGSKFNLEKAKGKIDSYYTARTTIPFLKNRDPFDPEIRTILQEGIITLVMGESDSTHPVILVARWDKVNKYPNVTLQGMVKVMFMMMDVAMLESDSIVINGMIFLEDLRGFSMAQVSQVTPNLLKHFSVLISSAYPLRLKGMHFNNMSSVFQIVIGLCKNILKEKLFQRMYFYKENSLDFLSKEFPISLIPDDFGGTADSLAQIKECHKKIESYADWFEKDRSYRTDETKRIGDPKIPMDLFGAEGSFRKLPID